jgi:alginate O-acetyltransferase complex protein AlgI
LQFNSFSYLALLAIVVAIFWSLPQGNFRRYYVLGLSILFYGSWSWKYTPIPIVICATSYLCARVIARNSDPAPDANPARARLAIWIGVTVVLCILAFFKYRLFVLDNLNQALQAYGHSPVQLAFAFGFPLGISFYSFEAISYLIDTRQGRVKNVRVTDLFTFVMFWPHLIAGPIVRVRELVPQLAFQKRFENTMLLKGMDRLIWGLVQKNLIANNIGTWVDEGFLPQSIRLNTTLDNWFLAFGFGLQVYFDFASYSNMAIGAAQLIGIVLPENFRFPYHAKNPSDFWSRWHMTLSRWIRDYLFFPVNAKYQASPVALYCSLIGIMALVGLWHGAGWGFVIWGIMHGFYLVIYRVSERFTESRPNLAQSSAFQGVWRVFTLLAVMAAWIPFRASSAAQAMHMLRTMVVPNSLRPSYSINFYLITILVGAIALIEPWMAQRFDQLEGYFRGSGNRALTNLLVWRPLLYSFGLLLFLIFDDQNTQFIYFQF